MKKLFVFLFTVVCITVNAQNSSASNYISSLNKVQQDVMQKFWNFTSTQAHSHNEAAINTKRTELSSALQSGIATVSKMQGLDGDASLRDSTLVYFRVTYNALTTDYAKIQQMETVSQKSYENMLAFMEQRNKVDNRMAAIGLNYDKLYKAFCARHNIKIIEGTNPLIDKITKANPVVVHQSRVFLAFFKAQMSENYMIEAMNRNDAALMEQARTGLKNDALEGAKVIDTVRIVNNDKSLVDATRETLKFFIYESDKMSAMLDYHAKKQKMDALNTVATKTKDNADIEKYNAAVDAYNKAADAYNATNKELNDKRNDAINKFNAVSAAYLDKNVPK
jgi:hypothetical protein